MAAPSLGQEQLLKFVSRFVDLDEAEKKTFLSAFAEVRVKKRQFIIQPNFVPKFRSYVVHGAFRSYLVADAGEEHTISFAIDDWWISDYPGYINQQPATMFVVALEDSIILQVSYEHEQELKKTNHKYETLFRIMAERGLAYYMRRLVANLTQTSEERYENFIANYSKMVQRVPQYALASFLGMSTEYLSRLRNNKVQKKPD